MTRRMEPSAGEYAAVVWAQDVDVQLVDLTQFLVQLLLQVEENQVVFLTLQQELQVVQVEELVVEAVQVVQVIHHQ